MMEEFNKKLMNQFVKKRFVQYKRNEKEKVLKSRNMV